MTKLFYHKADAVSQGARVTAHMFGTAGEAHNDIRHFTPDAAIANCSTSLRALQAQHGLDLPARELLEIQADTPEIERVLKAVLARQLRVQWDRGYEQVLGSSPSGVIPGFGGVSASALRSALELEQQTAHTGLDDLMGSLEVSPVWLEVEAFGVPSLWNPFRDRWQMIDMPTLAQKAGETPVAPIFHGCSPRVEGALPDQSEPRPERDAARNGYFNAVMSLPFYLPKRRSMLGLGSARELSDADRLQVARQAFESLAHNPEMMHELMSEAHVTSLEYVQELPAIAQQYIDDDEEEDYGYEDDPDEDDRDPRGDRPRG